MVMFSYRSSEEPVRLEVDANAGLGKVGGEMVSTLNPRRMAYTIFYTIDMFNLFGKVSKEKILHFI
jgi:hypothetical protein